MSDDIQRWNDYALALSREGESVVLVDVSGSMLDKSMRGDRKVTAAFKAAGGCDGQLVAFGPSEVVELAACELGVDVHLEVHIEGEGTPMLGALTHVRGMGPNVVTIVGDGAPTDGSPQEVFEAALRLGCPVNCLFVGGVPNVIDALLGGGDSGRDLMVAIAAATGGYFLEVGTDPTSSFSSLYEELSEGLQETLALPVKGGGR